jgi:chromosomal replication initiation ATPase DnaA
MTKQFDENDLVRAALVELLDGGMLTTVRIIRTVARLADSSPERICGPKKNHDVIHARMIAVSLTRELLPSLSFAAIGRRFRRDHATILNAYRRYGDLVRACLAEKK